MTEIQRYLGLPFSRRQRSTNHIIIISDHIKIAHHPQLGICLASENPRASHLPRRRRLFTRSHRPRRTNRPASHTLPEVTWPSKQHQRQPARVAAGRRHVIQPLTFVRHYGPRQIVGRRRGSGEIRRIRWVIRRRLNAWRTREPILRVASTISGQISFSKMRLAYRIRRTHNVYKVYTKPPFYKKINKEVFYCLSTVANDDSVASNNETNIC